MILHFFSYLVVRLLIALYGLIPARKAYSLGAGLGEFLYPLFRSRRKLSTENILLAKITDDAKRADEIGRKAFGHLAGHICEALKIGEVVTPENWRNHCTIEAPPSFLETMERRKDEPVLIITGHHGTWEAAVPVFSSFRPLFAVARKMNNPLVQRFLKKKHFRGDVTIIDKDHGFTSQVLHEWKKKAGAMTLIMDQHAGKKQGIMVDFLGRPASTHTSPARIHLATHAPLLVGSFIRVGTFQYKIIVAGDPIRYEPTGDHAADTMAIMTEINRRLEKVIRLYPEQYLWAHKRWR